MVNFQSQSRKDAFTAGHHYYFTGKRCKHGHLAPRQTTSGSCMECVRLAVLKNRRKKAAERQEVAGRRKAARLDALRTAATTQWRAKESELQRLLPALDVNDLLHFTTGDEVEEQGRIAREKKLEREIERAFRREQKAERGGLPLAKSTYATEYRHRRKENGGLPLGPAVQALKGPPKDRRDYMREYMRNRRAAIKEIDALFA